MNLGIGGIISPGGGAGGGGGTSGITTIDPGGNTGPTITFEGVNGIEVTGGSNIVVIDGAGASGVGGSATKFAAGFTAITSGTFVHNLGTEDVIVQIHDDQVPRRVLEPDEIKIENVNLVSVLFNTPQTGKVIII